MPLAGVTVADEERMLVEEAPRAAEEVASLDPDVVVFACTSAGALHGPPGDAELAARIGGIVHRPVVTVFGSVLEALRLVQAKRLLVFTPYADELNARMRAALEEGGVPVNSTWGMGLLSDVDIGHVDPADLLTRLRQKVGETHPDCVFMSCTNLRAWEILTTAQQELGTLVVSSNFLVYRAILRALNFPVPDLERPSWGAA
jgi:maleate isomerase